MPLDTNSTSALILAGSSASTFVRIADVHQVSFWVPPGWDTANIAIQLSNVPAPNAAPVVEVEWYTVADTFGEVLFPAKANHAYCLPTTVLLPNAMWMRLISGTSVARVVQSADRQIQIATRRY